MSAHNTISIHAPRGGSDWRGIILICAWSYFNPRSPWGERRTACGTTGRLRRNFNPRSPWGERLFLKGRGLEATLFQSTLPVGGATPVVGFYAPPPNISIHAPRGGSDRSRCARPESGMEFQSTLPVGGATRRCHRRKPGRPDFNPRSPWGERQVVPVTENERVRISIHAPRGGSDLPRCVFLFQEQEFQSTLPVGGATRQVDRSPRNRKDFNPRSPWGERRGDAPFLPRLAPYFNPRSPWGERLRQVHRACPKLSISIHAPRGGSDDNDLKAVDTAIRISIHAPRGGSDSFRYYLTTSVFNFNPRSPWGERQIACGAPTLAEQFQSTLPVGGATAAGAQVGGYRQNFNPRSPWGERRLIYLTHKVRFDFNPRSPWGERPLAWCWGRKSTWISIHAPRGGSDFLFAPSLTAFSDFNPRSPWGERLKSLPVLPWTRYFNPRSPWGERRCFHIHKMSDNGISIHAPRGGSDAYQYAVEGGYTDFNPRSPWGERLREQVRQGQTLLFQSTLPVGGATLGGFWDNNFGGYFNPRSPWGERRLAWLNHVNIYPISIHAPRGGSDQILHGNLVNDGDFNPRSPWGERQQICTDTLSVLRRKNMFFTNHPSIFMILFHFSAGQGQKGNGSEVRTSWHFPVPLAFARAKQ